MRTFVPYHFPPKKRYSTGWTLYIWINTIHIIYPTRNDRKWQPSTAHCQVRSPARTPVGIPTRGQHPQFSIDLGGWTFIYQLFWCTRLIGARKGFWSIANWWPWTIQNPKKICGLQLFFGCLLVAIPGHTERGQRMSKVQSTTIKYIAVSSQHPFQVWKHGMWWSIQLLNSLRWRWRERWMITSRPISSGFRSTDWSKMTRIFERMAISTSCTWQYQVIRLVISSNSAWKLPPWHWCTHPASVPLGATWPFRSILP